MAPEFVSGDAAQVTVTFQGRTSASYLVPLAPTAPGIFTQNATGKGYAVTFNQKGIVNLPAHWEGDVMTLFVTGIGQAASAIAIDGDRLPAIPLSVDKGTVPGVMQIKVPIPFGQNCDPSVVVRVGNAVSQPDVTIANDICI